MKDWKDWLFRYGVLLGTRHTPKQKLRFLRAAKKEFAQMGYAVDVTQSKLHLGPGTHATFYNLHAGDVKHAEVLIATYFDTPTKSFGAPYKAFTAHPAKREMVQNLLFSLALLAAGGLALCCLLVPRALQYGFMSAFGILTIALMCALLWGITKTRSGIPNRHNMVRNTSGLLATLALAQHYAARKDARVAFVLLDGMTHSQYAVQMLESYTGKPERQRVVYLDSVGNEGDVQVFTAQRLQARADVQVHPEMPDQWADIAITAGVYQGSAVVVPRAGTRRDQQLEEAQVDACVNAICEMLQ